MTNSKAQGQLYDCAVVGAGHAGLMLARLLADHGLSVALLDKRGKPGDGAIDGARPNGWALSVNLGSVVALRTAGLWDYLADQAQPLTVMRVTDPASKRDVLYRASDTGSEALSWGIAGRDLARGLERALADQGSIDAFWGEELACQHAGLESCRITCRSGLAIDCRLAVAADGRRSPLRQTARLDGPGVDFKQVALTVGVTTGASHGGEGFEILLAGGPLAFLPLPETGAGRPSASITWVRDRDQAERWQAAPPEMFARALRRHMPERLGDVRPATPLAAFPLTFSHAKRLIGDRLALIGDAAHGMHPIHAQGFNLAVRDVACLAELLVSAHRYGRDPGSRGLLKRYQSSRLPDTLATGAFTSGFGLLSSSANPLARGVIGGGAFLLQKLPALRHALTRQGLGEAPGRPRLLRGVPL
ncbi:MAG: FAD-dependent monooxygenase [Pseudomonadota bacterium]